MLKLIDLSAKARKARRIEMEKLAARIFSEKMADAAVGLTEQTDNMLGDADQTLAKRDQKRGGRTRT